MGSRLPLFVIDTVDRVKRRWTKTSARVAQRTPLGLYSPTCGP